MKKEDLVQYIIDNDTAKEDLIYLVLQRNNEQFNEDLYYSYQNQGIIHVNNINDTQQIFETLGYTLEDLGFSQEYGYEQNQYEYGLTKEGYLVPVVDHLGEILYFVNYSYKRDTSQKYIITYPTEYKEKLTQVKLMGLDDTKSALTQNKVIITEGVFDRLRLKAYNLPVMAVMGTSFTPYVQRYLKRFNQVIYIGDTDTQGKKSYQRAMTNQLYMFNEVVPKGKDIDEFATNYPEDCDEWIRQLKAKFQLA